MNPENVQDYWKRKARFLKMKKEILKEYSSKLVALYLLYPEFVNKRTSK